MDGSFSQSRHFNDRAQSDAKDSIVFTICFNEIVAL